MNIDDLLKIFLGLLVQSVLWLSQYISDHWKELLVFASFALLLNHISNKMDALERKTAHLQRQLDEINRNGKA